MLRRRTDPKTESKYTSTCHKSHFIQKFTGKMPRPRTQDHIVRDRRVAMHLNILQKPLYTDIYRKNATPQSEPRTQTATLCEPAQSKRISTCHKSGFIQKFTGKMPRPRMSPERGHTLRASLRGQNACHHVTRATLYRNFHVKCRGPD